MCKKLINKDSLIINVHSHDDRGTAVDSVEMALLAGAGSLDLITFAFNIYSQGIDPKLNLEIL
jgi:2-isopropylmalate synthase